MKTPILLALALVAATFTAAYSQITDGILQNNTFTLNDSIQVSVADTILIDLPAGHDFLFIEQQKKSKFSLSKLTKIGDVGSAVGGTLGSLGAVTGSLGTLNTGIKIMNTGAVARSVGMTSEAIENLDVSSKAKKLVGMKVIVEKLIPADAKGESFVTAILVNAQKSKDRYQVKLTPAILTGEVYIQD
ncbi:MAG: hypothetical protein M5Z89_10125 [Olivibacter sp.]|nr:hypothetical protein [Olivibacter sp. UJ_SKK_5.1]